MLPVDATAAPSFISIDALLHCCAAITVDAPFTVCSPVPFAAGPGALVARGLPSRVVQHVILLSSRLPRSVLRTCRRTWCCTRAWRIWC